MLHHAMTDLNLLGLLLLQFVVPVTPSSLISSDLALKSRLSSHAVTVDRSPLSPRPRSVRDVRETKSHMAY